jgi:hypothetical protein
MKRLPKALRDEEGIPEALFALNEARLDPRLREMLRERERFLMEEERRLAEVRREEREKAFKETVNKILGIMKKKGYDKALIERIRRRARYH